MKFHPANWPFRPRILELFGKHRPVFSLGGEITAGLTVGLIALPLALALGIASVPAGAETPLPAPALGIFTAVIAGFLISVLGGSRVQIGGPTAAFIPIVLLIVSEHGYSGLLVATMMAGAILVLMGFARMGTLIKYIPRPVTSGFTTGIAVAIMLTQIPDFIGLQTSEGMPREFFEKIPWLLENAGGLNLPSLAVAVACLAVILLWPRLRIHRVPGSIVAMLGATAFVALSGWGDTCGVATIGSKFGEGAIPSGFPLPALPQWDQVRSLIGPATAIALLGAIESLLSAVVADGLTGDRHDSNTELIAQGKKIPDGVVVYRIFGPFLFGAAEKMEDALEGIDEWPRILILRLHLVTAMDATGMNALESVVERMKQHGSTVILSGIHQQPLQMLRKAGFIEVIERDNFQATFDEALVRARSLLGENPAN